MSVQMVETCVSTTSRNGPRNGAPSRKGCVVNGQMTKASNKQIPPPFELIGLYGRK